MQITLWFLGQLDFTIFPLILTKQFLFRLNMEVIKQIQKIFLLSPRRRDERSEGIKLAVANYILQKVLFLAGVDPIFIFELVQNFIFYVQVLVVASDWAEVLCSLRGVQGQEG